VPLAFLYAFVCGLLRLLLLRGQRLTVSEIELLALRHERRMLRRTGGAAWRRADRLLLAALSRCLRPGERYRLPVRPATLRRWHRELLERRLVARGRRRGPGRPLSFRR
jgi:putative transposase